MKKTANQITARNSRPRFTFIYCGLVESTLFRGLAYAAVRELGR